MPRVYTIEPGRGMRNPAGELLNGASDGYYWCHGVVGAATTTEWQGPFPDMATARFYAIAMVNKWTFTHAKVKRSFIRVNIGKRSWQVSPHRWYVFPEDTCTSLTVSEGIRSGSGQTSKTYIKPKNQLILDKSFHGYFPEDYPPIPVSPQIVAEYAFPRLGPSPDGLTNQLYMERMKPTEFYGPMGGQEYVIETEVPFFDGVLYKGLLGAAGQFAPIISYATSIFVNLSLNALQSEQGFKLLGANMEYRQSSRLNRLVYQTAPYLPVQFTNANDNKFPTTIYSSDQYGNDNPTQYSRNDAAVYTKPFGRGITLIPVDKWVEITFPDYLAGDSTGVQPGSQIDDLFSRTTVFYRIRAVYLDSNGQQQVGEWVNDEKHFALCKRVVPPYPFTYTAKYTYEGYPNSDAGDPNGQVIIKRSGSQGNGVWTGLGAEIKPFPGVDAFFNVVASWWRGDPGGAQENELYNVRFGVPGGPSDDYFYDKNDGSIPPKSLGSVLSLSSIFAGWANPETYPNGATWKGWNTVCYTAERHLQSYGTYGYWHFFTNMKQAIWAGLVENFMTQTPDRKPVSVLRYTPRNSDNGGACYGQGATGQTFTDGYYRGYLQVWVSPKMNSIPYDNIYSVSLPGTTKYKGSVIGGTLSDGRIVFIELGFQKFSPVVNALLGEGGTFLPQAVPAGQAIVGFDNYTSTETVGPTQNTFVAESFVNPRYANARIAYITSDIGPEYVTDDAGGVHWKDENLSIKEGSGGIGFVGVIRTPSGQSISIYDRPQIK